MQLFKRQKFDKSDDNLEYTKQVLTQVTCFNDTMTYVKEQRNRKATAYTLNDPIKDRVIYTGDTLLILTKDKPENTDRLTARASLNGLKLENFDRDALDEYNHTLSDASWEIWKQMNFYGQSLKNHDSGNATGVVDEPVAMVCGTMSLHNYRPDTKFDRNSLCVYMLPDPKKNQPFSENGYSTVYAMSRRVLEIAPMEFVKFRIFPMTSGILNAYHSAFPSTPVGLVGPKTKAVKFGPVTAFGPDKLPKRGVSFGGVDKYVFTDRKIPGTLRRGTGKDGTVRQDPDKYEREVIRKTPEDPDEEKVDDTSVPLNEFEAEDYESYLEKFRSKNDISKDFPEVFIQGHPIQKMYDEFQVVINNVNYRGVKNDGVSDDFQLDAENIVGPLNVYNKLDSKTNLYRFIIAGSYKMNKRVPSNDILNSIATYYTDDNSDAFYGIQIYRMFLSVMYAMLCNYWPNESIIQQDLTNLTDCIQFDKQSRKFKIYKNDYVLKVFFSRERYTAKIDNFTELLDDAQFLIAGFIEDINVDGVDDLLKFPRALYQVYKCAFKIIKYFDKIRSKYNVEKIQQNPVVIDTNEEEDVDVNEATKQNQIDKTEEEIEDGKKEDDEQQNLLQEFNNIDEDNPLEGYNFLSGDDNSNKISNDQTENISENTTEDQTNKINELTLEALMKQNHGTQLYTFYRLAVDPDYPFEDKENKAVESYIAAAKKLENTPKFVELFQNATGEPSDENILKLWDYVEKNDIYEKFNTLVGLHMGEGGPKLLESFDVPDLTDISDETLTKQITEMLESKNNNITLQESIEAILKELSEEHKEEIKKVSDKVHESEKKIEIILERIEKMQQTQNETLESYQKLLDSPAIGNEDSQEIQKMVDDIKSKLKGLVEAQRLILEENERTEQRPPNWNNSDEQPSRDEAKEWFNWKSKNELLIESDMKKKSEYHRSIMGIDRDDFTERSTESDHFFDIKTTNKEYSKDEVLKHVFKNVLHNEPGITKGTATKYTYNPKDDIPEWILDPLESHFKKELENLVFRFCGVEIEPGNSGCRAELFHYPAIKHLFKSE